MLRLKLGFLTSLLIVSLFTGNANVKSNDAKIVYLAWHPVEQLLAVVYDDGRIDIHEGTQIKSLQYDFSVDGLIWHPTESLLLVSGRNSQIYLIDAKTGAIAFEFTKPVTGPNVGLSWKSDGTQIGIIQESFEPDNFTIWDIQNQTIIFQDTVSLASGLAWSPDQRYLTISYLFGAIDIRDGETFENSVYIGLSLEQVGQTLPQESIVTMAWDISGNYIVTGGLSSNIQLWHINDGKTFTYASNTNLSNEQIVRRVIDVWFDNEAKTFNSFTGDGTYRNWHTETGTLLVDINLGGIVQVATASPDGTQLAYVDEANELHIITMTYAATPADFTAHLATCTTDATLLTEWQQWLDDNDLDTLETAIIEARGDTLTVTCANELLIMLDVVQHSGDE